MAKRARPAPAPVIKLPKRPTLIEAVPRVVVGATLDDHLEIITRAIFQAGLSWAIIASRWDAFGAAFESFNVRLVAAYGEFDLARLMATPDVIHSAKKINGTFANAKTLIELDSQHGGIENYCASFESYAALYADAHRRFAFMGDLSCYYWLFRTAQHVPPFDEWIAVQKVDHPRMREMITLGRTEGTSAERPGF